MDRNVSTAEGNANIMPSDEFNPDVPGSAPHAPHQLDAVTEETLVYPADGKMAETARALLAAADNAAQVRWTGDAFAVPPEVAKRAKVPEADKGADVAHAKATKVTVPADAPTSAATVPGPADDGHTVPDPLNDPNKVEEPKKAAARRPAAKSAKPAAKAAPSK